MSKIDTVRAAMMQAMKDKNKERKESLSMLLSALKNKAIDKRADLTEEEENAVVLKEIKQCQEAIDTAPAALAQKLVHSTDGKCWLHHPKAETFLSERLALLQRVYK